MPATHLWVRQYARSEAAICILAILFCVCPQRTLSICIPSCFFNQSATLQMRLGSQATAGKWTPVVSGAAHLQKSFAADKLSNVSVALSWLLCVVKLSLFSEVARWEIYLEGRRVSSIFPIQFPYIIEKIRRWQTLHNVLVKYKKVDINSFSLIIAYFLFLFIVISIV